MLFARRENADIKLTMKLRGLDKATKVDVERLMGRESFVLNVVWADVTSRGRRRLATCTLKI